MRAKRMGKKALQCKLLPVFLIIALIGRGFHGLDAAEIFVGIERVCLKLDHRNGDVGAVVGDTLVVGEKIVEHKALAERTYALLKSVNMMELHLVAQRVDELLQRLDSLGKLKVLHNKRADGVVQNFAQGVCQNGKLVPRVAGESDPLLEDLLCSLGDNELVVGDKLKI